MRLEAATRVGVVWADKDARDTYKRQRAAWNKALFKPAPEQKWCYQCGWSIGPGEAYRQRGPKRRVPGTDAKSNFTCWNCPWTGPLDVEAVLGGLTPDALRLAQLWAVHIGQRRVDLTSAWQITCGEFDFRAWWGSVELLASCGVLRVPAGVDECGMPPIYVEALVKKQGQKSLRKDSGGRESHD